jgi:hypothetical protein
LVVGCWLLVVGCWLLVVGCWFGSWLLNVSHMASRSAKIHNESVIGVNNLAGDAYFADAPCLQLLLYVVVELFDFKYLPTRHLQEYQCVRVIDKSARPLVRPACKVVGTHVQGRWYDPRARSLEPTCKVVGTTHVQGRWYHPRAIVGTSHV